MKLENTNVHTSKSNVVQETRTEETSRLNRTSTVRSTQDPSESRATDHISLSALSVELRALAVDDADRLDKVESLRGLIDTGRYQVDSQQLGSHLIDDALAQGGAFAAGGGI